ncbi:MAG: hypothetical protein JOZ57_08180, partial [Abitibacteriaceae bacterium]|nr:hypothetical protein [Abditibacteriaceae bacterium]
AASVLISLVVGFAVRVQMGYSHGGLTLHPWFKENGANSAASTASNLFHGVSNTSWTNWCWLASGWLGSWLLLLLRARLTWFPIHPVGWLLVLGFPSHILWVSVFIGWGCKVLVTRYGGVDTMRKLTPAFLGLVLGDVTMMLFWLIIDGWQGRTFHTLVSS